MGKAIKTEKLEEEAIKNVEVPENAEEITKEETEKLEEEAIKNVVEKVYEVHTPNKSYSGLNCSIEFKNGVGTTKNEVIAEHFKSKGYEVKEL